MAARNEPERGPRARERVGREARTRLARAIAHEPELIAAFLDAPPDETVPLSEAIDDALAWRSDSAELHYFAARAALHAGDGPRADALLARAVALAPNSTDILILMARRAGDRGEHAAALGLLERALASGGDYADVHCLRGEMLACAGDRSGALRAFRRALAINPRYGAARERLARAAAGGGAP